MGTHSHSNENSGFLFNKTLVYFLTDKNIKHCNVFVSEYIWTNVKSAKCCSTEKDTDHYIIIHIIVINATAVSALILYYCMLKKENQIWKKNIVHLYLSNKNLKQLAQLQISFN